MNPIAQKIKIAQEKTENLLAVDDPRFLTNRELSWLEFNRRVLEEALERSNSVARTAQVSLDFLDQSRRIFYDSRFGFEGTNRRRCQQTVA